MDWWTNRVLPPKDLAILVVDLRNSSDFFLNSDDTHVLRFLGELSDLAAKVVRRVGRQRTSEAHIVKFTGDGFLVLFDEPEQLVGTPVGPARAVAVAQALRTRMRQFCDFWEQTVDQAMSARTVGLVSGIVYGRVHYGPIAAPAVRMADAAGEPVIRAFRLAQEREVSMHTDEDLILTCAMTRTLVERFHSAATATGFGEVRALTQGIEFEPVTLTQAKGVATTACLRAYWPAAAPAEAHQPNDPGDGA